MSHVTAEPENMSDTCSEYRNSEQYLDHNAVPCLRQSGGAVLWSVAELCCEAWWGCAVKHGGVVCEAWKSCAVKHGDKWRE